MEYLALIAENELLRTENEKFKQVLNSVRCPQITKKGKVHGMSSVLRSRREV